MIDWIKSWFGKGRVRVTWQGIDQDGHVRLGEATVPYVGKWNLMDMNAYIEKQIMSKFEIKVTKIKIVQHIEE